MDSSKAANGRHVVRIEREEVTDLPAGGLSLGQTAYYGLYFHEDEVAQAWAMETFQRGPEGGFQRGLTINLYADGSSTTMAFEGAKTLMDEGTNAFDGTWSFVTGSGRFAGITGGGSYDGRSFEGIAYSNVSGNAGPQR